jgi:hypothetical protein
LTAKKAQRCRKAAERMSRGMDRPLDLPEQLLLRLHLLLCTGCVNYHHQLQLMRSATKHWQNYQDDGQQGL